MPTLPRLWKRFGLLMLLGLLMSWLISCGGAPSTSETSADGSQEVEFWTMQLQPDFTDYFNELIADFEAENPGITVRWVDVPWGDMQSKILTAVSAGTAPDVVNLNPDFASQLASKQAWLPLDDRIPTADRSLYLDKIWRANTLDGESFGLPWYLTTRVTLYNTDIFAAADITEPPTTFEELATAAQQIK
ncbi:MAG: extracellular solute-binding protein, partial [Cyanobacteria bacterium P01_C01_bin.147]